MHFQAFSSLLDLLLFWLKPYHCRLGAYSCTFMQPIVLLITETAQSDDAAGNCVL